MKLFIFEKQIITFLKKKLDGLQILKQMGVKSYDSIVHTHLKGMNKGFYLGLAIIVLVSEGRNAPPIATNSPYYGQIAQQPS